MKEYSIQYILILLILYLPHVSISANIQMESKLITDSVHKVTFEIF